MKNLDLSAVDQDIIPDGNGTRNLGSSTKRFADLFLSGDTINLGGATISSDGSGTISISLVVLHFLLILKSQTVLNLH